MKDVYILGGLRSYIGVKNGIYKDILPEDLGSEVLKEIIKKYDIKDVNEVVCGNVIGTGGNIARLMCLKAGLNKTPAFTVDMQCASSIKAIELAMLKIKCNEASLIIAGGVESTSMKPDRIYNKKDFRYKKGEKYNVSQFCVEDYSEEATFKFGENVTKIKDISDKELNYFTIQSHKKAYYSEKNNELDSIITPVFKGSHDEGIKKNISEKLLERLPKIIDGGINNIGNISQTNDGASFVVLCSLEYLKRNKIKPKAKIRKITNITIDPLYSPMGAMEVLEKLLNEEKIDISNISAFEVNEAFAVISALFHKRYSNISNRYNIFGGALAYGHPYAASGAITTLHLIRALEKSKGRLGLLSIAASGGVSSSMLIERIDDFELL